MTTRERTDYMARHAARIATFTAAIPTISFGSYKPYDPSVFMDTALQPLRNALLADGHDNDGIVPYNSMFLPGSDSVALQGVDHAMPVMASHFPDFDRARFSNALLTLVLNRVHNQ